MMVATVEHILDDQENSYYTVEAVSVRMKTEEFKALKQWEDWWKWFGESSTALDALIPANVHRAQVIGPGVPLGFLYIRQWRVSDLECDPVPGLSAHALSLVSNHTCHKSWSTTSSDTQPFGGLPFRPDTNFEYSLVSGSSLNGELAKYDKGYAYSVLLPFHDSKQSINASIAALRANLFVDEATSAVSVGLFGYLPSRGQFFESFFLSEVMQSGSLFQTHEERLFRGVTWDTDKDRFVFLTDIFAAGYILWFVIVFVKDLRFHMKVAKNVLMVFSFWRAVDVAFIVLWILTMYFRFSLWSQGASVGRGFIADRAKDFGNDAELAENKAMLHNLLFLVNLYDDTMTLQGFAVLLTWLRLLAFIQQTERLGVVANTIAAMAASFIIITTMFLFLVVGLAMAGVLVYSSDFEPFSSFWEAFRLLLRFIFTQELTCKRGGACVQYTAMEKTNQPFTAFFINLTMVLGFIIFINIMIALVISNLMLVLASTRSEYKWSPQVLWKELITASRRMNPPWLAKLFNPFTSKLYKHNTHQDVKTAGPAKPGDLHIGQPVLVLLDEGSDWEEGIVYESVVIAGVLMLTIKIGGKKIAFDNCAKVHHPVPNREDKWLDVNLEERYVELIGILDAQPSKSYKMNKGEWLTMTEDFMPPRAALKLFELAMQYNAEASATEMGERFCIILTHRMNNLQDVLDSRNPKLSMIPRLREKELIRFTNILGPVTDTLIPHFTEASHDIRQLRQGLPTDFDDLTTDFSRRFADIAEQQTQFAPQLEYINRRL
eukprot:TRINITY_DN18858_c0_g1_i1.p1 TRINITY_DN18858_c0_g1~~TRINITY_DN18858_c0_g1_i1.p1  ORF type:complete len:774 (+),score=102.81 TRINITY_DN18858_c0_g1_i1:457-2778(+)